MIEGVEMGLAKKKSMKRKKTIKRKKTEVERQKTKAERQKTVKGPNLSVESVSSSSESESEEVPPSRQDNTRMPSVQETTMRPKAKSYIEQKLRPVLLGMPNRNGSSQSNRGTSPQRRYSANKTKRGYSNISNIYRKPSPNQRSFRKMESEN